jgi:hypothetical protein
VFPDLGAVEDANWFMDEFSENQKLALLKCTVPKNWLGRSSVDYELMVTRPGGIPPDRIEVAMPDLDAGPLPVAEAVLSLFETFTPDAAALRTALTKLTKPVPEDHITTTLGPRYVFPDGTFRVSPFNTHKATMQRALDALSGHTTSMDDEDDDDFDQMGPDLALVTAGVARFTTDRLGRAVAIEAGANVTDRQLKAVRDAAQFGRLANITVDLIDSYGLNAAHDTFPVDDDRLIPRIRGWMRKHQ